MTEEEAKDAARDYIALYGALCCVPEISPDEVEMILKASMNACVWTPDTFYRKGQKVLPPVRNGHWYECARTGTSYYYLPPTAEWPVWTVEVWSETPGGVAWVDAGVDYEEKLFNYRLAIHSVWVLKATKAAHLVNQSVDHNSISASLLHEQCLAQASRFAPFVM